MIPINKLVTKFAVLMEVPDVEIAVPTPDKDQAIDQDLEDAMASPEDTKMGGDSPAEPKKGKKNARFGRNPDGTPAKKQDKKEVERRSEWGKFLHKFKQEHKEYHSLQATIEARKVYIPSSGKQKSFERIFTEVWKTKNPMWQSMSKEQRVLAIRESFVKSI